jgi:phage head maturation protease
MSFAFGVRADTWDKGADGVAERTLLDLYLREVSPVTFPAYPATAVQVRSLTIPDLDNESDGQEADEIPAAPTDDRAVERTAMRRRRLNLFRS